MRRGWDNHHHVVCRVCGAARDIECANGAGPCLEPSETGGFAIDEAEITVWGVAECQSAALVHTFVSGDRTSVMHLCP
jgi:Fur family transcriptional regulator, stress-responsive regulator